MGMPIEPTFAQAQFRFRDSVTDPAALNTAFDAGDTAQNTQADVDVDVLFRLRITVDQTNAAMVSAVGNPTPFLLQFNHAGGGYTDVGTEGGGTAAVESDTSASYSDGDATTELLTNTYTFLAGNGNHDNTTASVTFTDETQESCEIEFGLRINASVVADNDEIQFRLLWDPDGAGADTVMAYTVTPSLLVNEPTTPSATSDFDIPISTQAGTGERDPGEGSSTSTAPITTQAGEGTATHESDSAPFDIPLTTQTGTGESTHESDSAPFDIPITTQTGTGTAGLTGPSGEGAFEVLMTTQDATGERDPGEASSTFDIPISTQTGTGESTHESDSATFDVPITTQTGSGKITLEATSAGFDIPLSTQTGTGQNEYEFLESSFEVPLPEQSGTGSAAGLVPEGTSSMTIPLSTQEGVGTNAEASLSLPLQDVGWPVRDVARVRDRRFHRRDAMQDIEVAQMLRESLEKLGQTLPEFGVSVGSLLYLDASGWHVLEPGNDDDLLTMVSGVPRWVAPRTQSQGEVSINGNITATAITTQNIWTLFDETTALGEVVDFDSPEPGRLRYTGTRTKTFFVSASISLSGAGATTDEFSIAFVKNGTVDGSKEYVSGTIVTESTTTRKLNAGGDVGAMDAQAMISLSTNDYVELFLMNQTDALDPVIEDANIAAIGFG